MPNPYGARGVGMGYGVSPVPHTLGTPQELEGDLGVSDLAPHIHAPFHSRSLCFANRAVLGVPIDVDPAANAAGILLAAAEGIFTLPVLTAQPTTQSGQVENMFLLTPAIGLGAPLQAQTVLQYQTPPGHIAVFRSWGITVHNSTPEAVKTSASIGGGPNSGSTGPNPRVSGAAQELHQPTMVILPDNKILQINVQNRDTASPVLVTVGLCGWLMSSSDYKDTLESMVSRPGFGMCRRRG